MDVGLGRFGQVVIHDVLDPADVESAGGDVGGYQYRGCLRFELVECPFAGGLAFVAVDRGGADFSFLQVFDELVCPVLGAGKDQGTATSGVRQEFFEQLYLHAAVDKVDRLLDLFGGCGVASGLDIFGLIEPLTSKFANLGWHGGGEHQCLPAFGYIRFDATQIVDETHVEHLVGLVKDEHLNVAEVDVALADKIDQAAGSGDQRIDTTAELANLWHLRDTAVNHDVA